MCQYLLAYQPEKSQLQFSVCNLSFTLSQCPFAESQVFLFTVLLFFWPAWAVVAKLPRPNPQRKCGSSNTTKAISANENHFRCDIGLYLFLWEGSKQGDLSDAMEEGHICRDDSLLCILIEFGPRPPPVQWGGGGDLLCVSRALPVDVGHICDQWQWHFSMHFDNFTLLFCFCLTLL